VSPAGGAAPARASVATPGAPKPPRPTVAAAAAAAPVPRSRELYIDAFRGLMAFVMVQGHVFERLLAASARAEPLYQAQLVFHGSTAPGFLFASGFVAGLPRAPISLRAGLRRARRLLFVLGVGYWLHLPYFSFWKIRNEATPAEMMMLFACNALQVIAVTQLVVLVLQWLAGQRWVAASGALLAAILATGPLVVQSGHGAHLPPWLASYLDRSLGSEFPVFPFSAFVLAGVVAGAVVGRQEPGRRHLRAVGGGLALLALGASLTPLLEGRVDFWRGASPAYALLRIGGLLLLLRLIEWLCERGLRGMPTLALFGRETLLVYVLHLYLLHGGIISPAPLGALRGGLGFAATAAALVAMLPLLLAAAWLWHRLKTASPRAAFLTLAFLTSYFLWELFTRPW
jgi:hypothetical protein